jgi:hypothetical protein
LIGPGVFIRGDDALSYARNLSVLIAAAEQRGVDLAEGELSAWARVVELRDLLASCRGGSRGHGAGGNLKLLRKPGLLQDAVRVCRDLISWSSGKRRGSRASSVRDGKWSQEMTLRLASDNPFPNKSSALLEHWPWGNALMTPDQHRRQAALLRQSTSPRSQELAIHHDNLAKMIEHRHTKRPGVG